RVGPDVRELEQPAVDVVLERRAIEAVVEAQGIRTDRGQPAGEAAQLAHLSIEGRPGEVLDVVVERVHAVERRRSRPQLVQVAEIVVDEMLDGFERVHGPRALWSVRRPDGALPGGVGRGDRSHVRWYNTDVLLRPRRPLFLGSDARHERGVCPPRRRRRGGERTVPRYT